MIKANPNATQSEFDGKVIIPWVNLNLPKNEAEAFLLQGSYDGLSDCKSDTSWTFLCG